ncbi:L,D-transpeptidase [Vreelandella populi]|uniref:Murein L,D-transpeptidase n=1 Tax=Vreelandella populi TaxID=2498858 RepID=A0A3S0WLK2_9GAMM|nr:L,D-transpeptidase [Halomonas populi]RUR40700.1 murein L,D-transpeptidase [Halomonas populi]RUR49206.1 murein L,D-transpeptidase [Halomonas populi]RUR55697.1 murein L,D-transpeptidase [Halomonas populi]
MRTPTLAELPPSQDGWVEIDIEQQKLRWWQGREMLFECDISSGEAGVGQQEGSGRTPHGWHYVRASIGDGLPENVVFRGRRWTGEVFSEALASAHPERDWILTRILWLCGLEKGVNRGGQVDSQRRYIYLHGTPPDQPMGKPASHGCIRMRNQDLLHLFECALPGTPVWLHGSGS